MKKRWAFWVVAPAKKGSGPICAKHPPGRSGKRGLTPFLLAAMAAWSTSALAQGPMVQGTGSLPASLPSNSGPPPASQAPPGMYPAASPIAVQKPLAPGPLGALPVSQVNYAPSAGEVYYQPAASYCGNPPSHYTPYMLGDFLGPIGSLFGDIKVAEGNSPRPVDRVFLDANFYNNIFKDRWKDPAETLHHVDYLRYIFGFEKTFMDQNLSITVRVPFVTIAAEGKDPSQGPGESSFTSTGLGNLSTIVKAVLCEDKASGSLLSGGATISVPTASSRLIDPGPGTLAFIAPFMGFIVERGDFYVQGFSSMTLPLARPESILLFNDVGVGYFVFRNNSGCGLLRSIAPTVEVHVLTPLRQADSQEDLYGIFDKIHVHDVVDLTAGLTTEFSNRSTLGLGFVTPVTGPKPFDFEFIAQFNVRF